VVILGIGTNIGDRLYNLRCALRLIKKIPNLHVKQMSPLYVSDALLPEGAPDAWDMPHLNLAIRCETHLAPYDLLGRIKYIENALGRKPAESWSPRIIDIDILAWDNLIHYDSVLHIPHEHLHERPFALWPLADVAPDWVYPLSGAFQHKTAAELATQWGPRDEGKAPLHTRQIQQRIDTSQLVGTLNVTPDSFSDGGIFVTTEQALNQAKHLVSSGAEIIDIGAEATGPAVTPITAAEEWRRLEPILTELIAQNYPTTIKPKISVDTYHPATAKKALGLGVHWINDVSGGTQLAMQEVFTESTCDIVIMHHLTLPASQQHVIPLSQNHLALIHQWAGAQLDHLQAQGISKERIIFDVGLGFGKTAHQSLALVKNIHLFRSLGIRLLVGHSRKSFLQQFISRSPAERDLETVIMSLYLNEQAVDYLRVHNVDLHARAFKVTAALYP
jgi:2-amino-4-hydroxy-6-hydroxymethyldihydropteridine diphosphokinase / dihydropteroate synthase